MTLNTRSHSRNLAPRSIFRSIACPLLAGVSLCVFYNVGFAQSVPPNNRLRGTLAANADIVATDDIDAIGSVPLVDQPVSLNPAQGSLPALSSVYNDDDGLVSRENPSIGAEQGGTGAQNETDPFAPPGFRLGASIANITLEQSIGASNNITQTTNGESGFFSQTNLNFNLRTDWARHELTLNAAGSFRSYMNGVETDRPSVNLGAGLRLDLIDGYTTTIGATYGFDTESLTSNSLGTDVTSRPGVHSYGTTAAIVRTGRRINLSLRGAIDRTLYDEATTTAGLLDQSDRDNTNYNMVARIGYDTGAAYKPFVEAGAGVTRYDEEIDRNGDQRNSTTFLLRTGIELDISEKLTGEIAVGYVAENYDSGNLASLEGFTFDALINWSPSRETVITLNAATSLNGSTTAGDNGSINYSGGITATRQINDRWSASFNAGFSYDFDEQADALDANYTLGTGARYWMSRYMAISADLDHTIYESSDGVNDYQETTAMLGIILQR